MRDRPLCVNGISVKPISNNVALVGTDKLQNLLDRITRS
jgi:hypothetical protein